MKLEDKQIEECNKGKVWAKRNITENDLTQLNVNQLLKPHLMMTFKIWLLKVFMC